MFKVSSYDRFLGRFVYLILLHLFSDTSIVQMLHKDYTQYGMFVMILRNRYYLFALRESTLILIE